MSGANITAGTIPSNAISGGLSVSLPTTTMTTRTATQIGYTQTSTTASISYPNGTHTLTSITLNGPVGSVWITSLFVGYNNPLGNYSTLRIFNDGTTIAGWYIAAAGGQLYEQSLMGFCTVGSAANGNIVSAVASSPPFVTNSVILKATRIA